ncbi:MAG: putative HTH-type transcriptional regulator YttP [bacterium ADurb.Bin478]|nr:MAG: putative HTH-type transcriptional regulator YttP [bacterium ADurb.Bin478]
MTRGARGETLPTREKIKEAAGDVFLHKGYAAARMQEIADRADVNKALIYYYFSSKDSLFEAIIREASEELVMNLSDLFTLQEKDPRRLIKRLVHVHFTFLLEHPQLPSLLVRELNSDNVLPKKVLADVIMRFSRGKIGHLQQLFDQAAAAKQLRRTNVQQLLWSIFSLNVFSFVSWPVIEGVWPEIGPFDQAMRKREKAITDLILNSLLPRRSD